MQTDFAWNRPGEKFFNLVYRALGDDTVNNFWLQCLSSAKECPHTISLKSAEKSTQCAIFRYFFNTTPKKGNITYSYGSAILIKTKMQGYLATPFKHHKITACLFFWCFGENCFCEISLDSAVVFRHHAGSRPDHRYWVHGLKYENVTSGLQLFPRYSPFTVGGTLAERK